MEQVIQNTDLTQVAFPLQFLFSLTQFFFTSLYVFIQFLIILVEIRYLVNWFLNVNPFFEPFLTLWAWTNPIFNFGRRWYPRIFGLDITPIINYKALNLLLDICDEVLGYTKSAQEGEQFDNGVSPDLENYNADNYQIPVPHHHLDLGDISNYLNLSDSII